MVTYRFGIMVCSSRMFLLKNKKTMNLITYKSKLEEQIKDYKDFIPFTKDHKSMFKLMREIHRLSLLVDMIKEMNFDQLTNEFDIEIKQRSSIINYPKNGV